MMKLKRNQAFIIVEVAIVLVAGILAILDVPFKDLILPVSLPVMVLVIVLFYGHTTWVDYAIVIIITMSFILDVFTYHYEVSNHELSHVLNIVSRVLDFIWPTIAIGWFLFYTGIIKKKKKKTTAPGI